MELTLYALIFAFLGFIAYFVDMKYGTRPYTWWWNFTHKDKLPEGVIVGFLCGRPAKDRIVPALILTIISCFLLHTLGDHDVVVLLLKGMFLIFPGFFVGFMLAGMLARNPKLSPRVDSVFKTIDEIEKGKTTLGAVATTLAHEAKERGEKALAQVSKEISSRTTEANSPPPAQVQQPEPPKRPRPTLAESLNEFRNRK
jgi:hypothetical protein